MSFNKKFIPNERNYLKKEYLKIGHSAFIKKYVKYDAFFSGHHTNSFFISWVFYKNKKYVPVVYEVIQYFSKIKSYGISGTISNIKFKINKLIKLCIG